MHRALDWAPYLKEGHGTVVCRNMRNNMEQFNKMWQQKMITPKNFLEVNYDSWMKNKQKVTLAILRFLDIKPTHDLIKKIRGHFTQTKLDTSFTPFSLSTYRGQYWDTQSWKKDLSPEQITYIDYKCRI